MIQDIGEGRFRNEYHPQKPGPDSRVLFYQERNLFARKDGDRISFLTWSELSSHATGFAGYETYLFSIDGIAYYLFRDADQIEVLPADEEASRCGGAACSLFEMLAVFSAFSWHPIEILRTGTIREISQMQGDAKEPADQGSDDCKEVCRQVSPEFFAGVTGFQLFNWYQSRKFCPRCGEKLVHDAKERMMRCPICGQMEYPKICPAVIVGVIDRDRLLLTKYAGRSFKKYALIAGFAEIGEPIEGTVRREVMEEVGLKVKNIRYYRSQPWSFTDTLLMGFFADVDGDDGITLDETELSEGKWCTRDEIPEDDGVSLTREMMRMFKEGKVQ